MNNPKHTNDPTVRYKRPKKRQRKTRWGEAERGVVNSGAFGKCHHYIDPAPALKPAEMRKLARSEGAE